MGTDRDGSAAAPASLSGIEQQVVQDIAQRRDELVALASALIGFDTTVHPLEDPPRDEAALQSYLAERLRAVGAVVDLWEPAAAEVAGRA